MKQPDEFIKFCDHPFIASIADRKHWTMSCRLTDKNGKTTKGNKAPIDMYMLKYRQTVQGAKFQDERSCVSLDELSQIVLAPPNCAYFLDALTDNFVVLDIEPSCPDTIKKKLLQLDYIYGEISMSKKGYHLVFPLPDCINEYPNAIQKIVFKEKHGYYEILLNHWVTFTRNMLPDATGNNKFELLFRKMASEQKQTVHTDVDFETDEPSDIKNKDTILDILKCQKYNKTPEDFFNDMSKYEFGYISFLYTKLKQILAVSSIKNSHDYTESEKIWLLYYGAKAMIPYREKHEEQRNKMPWLLYLSEEVAAKSNDD